MLIKTKIDFKKYLIFSLFPTLITSLTMFTFVGFFITWIFFFITIVNQLMLIEIVFNLLLPEGSDVSKKSGLSIALLFIAKFALITLALVISAQFIGSKIIFLIINYVVQIFNLIYSIKRVD